MNRGIFDSCEFSMMLCVGLTGVPSFFASPARAVTDSMKWIESTPGTGHFWRSEAGI